MKLSLWNVILLRTIIIFLVAVVSLMTLCCVLPNSPLKTLVSFIALMILVLDSLLLALFGLYNKVFSLPEEK